MIRVVILLLIAGILVLAPTTMVAQDGKDKAPAAETKPADTKPAEKTGYERTDSVRGSASPLYMPVLAIIMICMIGFLILQTMGVRTALEKLVEKQGGPPA